MNADTNRRYRAAELYLYGRTPAEKQCGQNVLIDELIAQVPEWADVLRFDEGPELQCARDTFMEILARLQNQGVKVGSPLSDEVKTRIAAARKVICMNLITVVCANKEAHPEAYAALWASVLESFGIVDPPANAPRKH